MRGARALVAAALATAFGSGAGAAALALPCMAVSPEKVPTGTLEQKHKTKQKYVYSWKKCISLVCIDGMRSVKYIRYVAWLNPLGPRVSFFGFPKTKDKVSDRHQKEAHTQRKKSSGRGSI